MPTVAANLIGRTGNKMFIYAYARAYAEQHGMELRTDAWVGEQIFDIQHPRIQGNEDVVLNGYFQDQASLIYTRKQVREWFKFRWQVEQNCSYLVTGGMLAHQRRGDYERLGYVVVSELSYCRAMEKLGLDPHFQWIREESALWIPRYEGELSFLPDFYRMTKADVLFRGNSSFSWWAATLGNARVFSPVIEGLEGGKEQDCEFVEGNWPRFANLEFVTDLHLSES